MYQTGVKIPTLILYARLTDIGNGRETYPTIFKHWMFDSWHLDSFFRRLGLFKANYSGFLNSQSCLTFFFCGTKNWQALHVSVCNGHVNSLTSIHTAGLYCKARSLLTHWGRDKMAAIFQTTFSDAFSWIKIYELRLIFHWVLFLRVQLTIFQHWFE